MAVYRYIHTSFWDDAKVQDNMSPIERYFMLYLLTNSHTKQCGVYEISKKQMSFETDIKIEQLQDLLNRFENDLKVIKYDDSTKEILITNWYKYNWTASEKVKKCILNEIKDIKSNELLEYLNRVCIPYIYPKDTLSIPNNKEKEKEKEKQKEEIKEKNTEKINSADLLQKYFIECLGSTNLNAIQECISYLDDLPIEVIRIALQKTADANANWKYTKTILNNWVTKKIDSVEKVKIEDENFKSKRNNSFNQQEEIEKFLKETEND